MPSAADLLRAARASTPSPVARDAFARLADVAADLFEVRSVDPGRVVCGFDDPRCLWIISNGSVRMELRSAEGRHLPAIAVLPGSIFGKFPGVPARPWPPELSFAARALTRVDLLVLPPERYDALLARVPDLVEPFTFLDRLIAVLGPLVWDLRRLPGLAKAPIGMLAALVWGAECVRVTTEGPILRNGEVPDRVFALLDGSLRVLRRDSVGRVQDVPAMLGDMVGLLACIVRGPSPEEVLAEPGTLLAAIPGQAFVDLLSRCPVARRTLEVPLPEGVLDLVRVATDEHDFSAADLTTLLARVLFADLHDRTAILRLVDGPPAERRVEDGVVVLEVSAKRPEDVPFAIRVVLAAESPAPDLVFLHPAAPPAYLLAAEPMVSRVAWLSRDPDARPNALAPVERAGLLGPYGGKPPLWCPGVPRMRLDPDEVRRLVRDGIPPLGDPRTATPTRSGLARWARALTNRLVGIALGGGGSPGFSHVSLIRALEERFVPIDVVTGTSFGALVGAWYAGLVQLRRDEPERLQSLVDAGNKLNFYLRLGFFDSGPLANFVDETFEGLLLGDLEVPFFPVSSEADSGTEYVGRSESLGQAVRFSGAFPPFFPPVVKDAATRLLDGGFVDNVPSSVLRLENVGLAVASNSIGLLPPRKAPRIPGKLGEKLASYDPIGRVIDCLRAGLLLFHRIGDSQTIDADLVFESRYTGFEFWDFARGNKVIGDTQASADAFADHLVEVVTRVRG